MATTTKAGEMQWRFRFERRATDANGDRMGDWGDGAVTLDAKLVMLKGTEAVMSARLQGRQPVVLTIRDCAAARAITTDWRAVDIRNGAIFGVKGAAQNANIAFIDVLAQAEGTSGG
jgi:hypothetical protein